MHPFESAGLGKAPFRYLGRDYKVGPIDLGNGLSCGAPGQPMGTCDHCLRGISNCYNIESADGKRFVVGCDCVEKLYDRDTKTPLTDSIFRQIDKARKQAAKEARWARQDEIMAKGYEFLDLNRAALEGMPMLTMYQEKRSAWDHYQWYKSNAGVTGKIKMIKTLTKRIKNDE